MRRFLRLTAESPNRLRRARLAGESPYAVGGELDKETRETQRWLILSFPEKMLAFGGPMKYIRCVSNSLSQVWSLEGAANT